jgi:NADH:ubiquinone oxidoreductase subunit B-like Fe-S oxidoreductase
MIYHFPEKKAKNVPVTGIDRWRLRKGRETMPKPRWVMGVGYKTETGGFARNRIK